MLKSFYLPNEALQGEDIPAHVTWDNLDWDTIIITYSDSIDVEDVYNVLPDCLQKENHRMIIKSTEIDGYIGLLFKTNLKKGIEIIAELDLEILKDKKAVLKEKRKCQLLHPELKILSVPDCIKISNNKITNRIKIKNIGYGTLILRIMPIKENNIKIDIPPDLKKTLNDFEVHFKNRIGQLKSKYTEPECQKIIDLILKKENINIEDSLEPLDNLYYKVKDNEDFIEDLSKSFKSAYLQTVDIQKRIVDPIISYFSHSMSKNLYMLENIFTRIYYNGGKQILHVKILSNDLLNQKYPDLEFSPITIISDNEGSIRLMDVFEFGGEHNFAFKCCCRGKKC